MSPSASQYHFSSSHWLLLCVSVNGKTPGKGIICRHSYATAHCLQYQQTMMPGFEPTFVIGHHRMKSATSTDACHACYNGLLQDRHKAKKRTERALSRNTRASGLQLPRSWLNAQGQGSTQARHAATGDQTKQNVAATADNGMQALPGMLPAIQHGLNSLRTVSAMCCRRVVDMTTQRSSAVLTCAPFAFEPLTRT